MLNDTHLKVLKYVKNGKEVFPSVDIKGGIAITLHDTTQQFGKIGTFVPIRKLNDIKNKVSSISNNSLSRIIYSNTSYKYSKLFFKEHPDFAKRVSGGSKRYLSSPVFSTFPEVFYKNKPATQQKFAHIVGLYNKKRAFYYFPEKYLNPPNNYNGYKVLVSASNGSGTFGEVLSSPFIGQPSDGHTETFISIGSFKNKLEANNCLKYLKTKFARTLLSINKVTPGNKKASVWEFIPLQDFTQKSKIKWSRSIPEIDQLLYEKYKLSEDEINFIEEKVAPME